MESVRTGRTVFLPRYAQAVEWLCGLRVRPRLALVAPVGELVARREQRADAFDGALHVVERPAFGRRGRSVRLADQATRLQGAMVGCEVARRLDQTQIDR